MKKEIIILGLGCGNKGDITLNSLEALKNADKVYLRTKVHPGLELLDEYNIAYETFDYLYEKEESFDTLYEKIANIVLKAEYKKVVYAVPGSSLYAERAANLIINNDLGVSVKVLPSVSFVEGIFACLKRDATEVPYKVLDALNLDNFKVDINGVNIICQVYDKQIASNLKLKLMETYNEEVEVYFINGAMSSEEEIKKVKLYEIDRVESNHLTSVVILPVKFDEAVKDMDSFTYLIEYLRGENGCPWDRKQTHESLIPNLIEEAYEVIDAIESGDSFSLMEELGDLLLQIVLHVQIAKEEFDFNFNDVIGEVASKIIRRHPYVFEDVKLEGEDTFKIWDSVKAKEKNEETYTQRLNNVTKNLPSLMYAQKVQAKASKANFDFPNYKEALEKVYEEIDELKEAIENNLDTISEEAGDVLFAISNVIRILNLNGEVLLKDASKKFITRFDKMERKINEDGFKLDKLDMKTLDRYWKNAKKTL